MTEVFRKYGGGQERPEDKEPIACVVRHPDAGGPCQREAIGEVWSLSFCGLHGREAELAAAEEMGSSLEGIFAGLVAIEQERHDRNEKAVRIIKEVVKTSSEAADTLAHAEAIAAAYPPGELAANTDPDTLRYDYGSMGMDNPHDWWCEAQIMVCRFMRQAHDRGLAGLLTDLEYARERATVQRLLAERYMDRQYGPAKLRT